MKPKLMALAVLLVVGCGIGLVVFKMKHTGQSGDISVVQIDEATDENTDAAATTDAGLQNSESQNKVTDSSAEKTVGGTATQHSTVHSSDTEQKKNADAKNNSGQPTASGVANVGSEKSTEIAVCQTVEFAHEKIHSHDDGQLCTEHENLVVIDQVSKKPSSVCVRVDGRVVENKFSLKGQQLDVSFAAGAGPKSKVRVTVCQDQKQCAPCKIEKDRFMASIGIDEAMASDEQGNRIEEEYSKLNVALKEADKEISRVFKGWSRKNDSHSCVGDL